MKGLLSVVLVFGPGELCFTAPFDNLDFEMAATNRLYATAGGFAGSLDDLLPSWELSIGDSPVTEITFDTLLTGSPFAALLGPRGPSSDWISGRHTLFLLPGLRFGTDEVINYSLRQEGEVPSDAQSLLFDAREFFGEFFEVRVNGEPLPISVLGSGPRGSVLLGADISRHAGATVRLELATQNQFSRQGFSRHVIDNLRFSPTAVPEPGPNALLLGAGMVWIATRRCRHIPE